MSDWLQSVICACNSARADSPSIHYRTLMEESSLYSRLPCLDSIHLFVTCGHILTWLSTQLLHTCLPIWLAWRTLTRPWAYKYTKWQSCAYKHFIHKFQLGHANHVTDNFGLQLLRIYTKYLTCCSMYKFKEWLWFFQLLKRKLALRLEKWYQNTTYIAKEYPSVG